MKTINAIPSRARVPLAIGGGLLLIGIVTRAVSDVPQVEVFDVQTAALNTAEPEPVSDPYQVCQQNLNAALLNLQTAQTDIAGDAAAGRAQDWRRWARDRAQTNGTSEVQELRAAFSAISSRLDQAHLTTAQTIGAESVSSDVMDINATVGAYRDLEGSRLDIAMALATAQTAPYESVNTTELRNAAIAFLDTSGCLVGMEVLDVE